jgi:EmrB/QacA subfamily drug resistance transporter
MGNPATATAAPAVAVRGRRLLVMLGSLLLGMVLASLDQTIVATALPTIVGELGGLPLLAWAMTAYLLASTASTPLWGKLGDLYARKPFFQAAIVTFLIGSALSGASESMGQLIAFRAIQGLGAGGLIVGAAAIIGELVPPRERGRYEALFGTVLGLANVAGPLVGGVLVDGLSWRWVFYVNLPLGIAALIATNAVIPASTRRSRRVIVDYLGSALLAAAVTGLVLVTSLGGRTVAWDAPVIIGLALGSIVLAVLFMLVERRAAEPVLPTGLFRNRVFLMCSLIGFCAGFLLFGAITLLPLYFQVVKGVDPTDSGAHLLPMMGGLLLTSIVSGQLISRWGRYKAFPVVGTGLATVAMFLLSRVGVGTSEPALWLDMLMLGAGIGAVMQVLVVAAQSSVDYDNLGGATSGVMFFRSIGGAFGTAVLGAVFATSLSSNLAERLARQQLPPGLPRTTMSLSTLNSLPPPARAAYIQAFADSFQTVFLVGLPVAAIAFVLSWLLPEIELRRTSGAIAGAEAFAIPNQRTSQQELEHALSVLSAREERSDMYRRLAERGGVVLEPAPCWLLFRIRDLPGATLDQLADTLKVSKLDLRSLVDALVRTGLLEVREDGQLVPTAAGRAAADRLSAACRAGLDEVLQGWLPEQQPELAARLDDFARELLTEGGRPPRQPQLAGPAAADQRR